MKLNNETRIGVLVVVVLAVLAVLTWKAGDFKISYGGYDLKVLFKTIDGIEANAPVTLNGLEVGRVKDIQILYSDKNLVELTLFLDKTARIHEGAEAYVRNLGFMGEKYVGLTTGDNSRPLLKPGDVIIGLEPASLDKILSEGEDIAVNIRQISSQINERLRVNSQAIDDIISNMRASMGNVASISDHVNQHLEKNDHHIDDIVANLNTTSKNLEELSYDLKENPWKLLYKSKQKEIAPTQ